MAVESARFAVVVMAKRPIAGRVKTRLQPTFTAIGAAAVHQAMMLCVLERLESVFGPMGADLVLALDVEVSEAVEPAWQAATGLAFPSKWRGVRQGSGHLGDRINFVADEVLARETRVTPNSEPLDQGDAIAFFGVDSPDLPSYVLASLGHSLKHGTAAVGPVEDGGYWTLAAKPWRASLVADIDWGTAKVYHQTIEAIAQSELASVALTPWFDVDQPEDLVALQQRLNDATGSNKSTDPALQRLAEQLKLICEDESLMPDANPDTNMPADPSPQASAEPADDDMNLEDSTVLIVDDNEQNVELLQAYLESLPCKIVTAFNGEEAMAFVEASDKPSPDLILLDVMMPKMSGFEVCQKIKEDPKTRSIMIMMVTALNEVGDIERGVDSGTDDFLTKPVNKLELITRVKSLLRVRHLKRELDRTMAYIEDIESGLDDDASNPGSNG